MNHSLRCRCGTIRGHVALPAMTSRAVCYCLDCQTFARFLGPKAAVLDEAGGSELVAVLPRQVHFEQGLESMACMSLKEGGLLRWYASCCRTAIGNTPGDRKLSFVGLLHNCLSSQPMDASFGPARIRLHTASATRPVEPARMASLAAIFKLMKTILPTRLNGRYRENPFFDAKTGESIRRPQALSATERAALEGGG